MSPSPAQRRVASEHVLGLASVIDDMIDSGDEATRASDLRQIAALEKVARWLRGDARRRPHKLTLAEVAGLLEDRATEVQRWTYEPWEEREMEYPEQAEALRAVARWLLE